MTLSASSVPSRDRLERFRALRARLDPSGAPEDAMEVYVEAAGSVSARIAAELSLAPSSTHLLIGGIGSGRTTQLLAAQALVSQIRDTRALYIDVSKRQDIAKIVPGVISADVLDRSGWGSHRSRHLMVMLDGLDRITDIASFEQIVIHDVKTLSSLGVGVVLVGPLRVLYGLDRTISEHFDSLHYQPWLDAKQDQDSRMILHEVLRRRVPEQAFSDTAIDALVLASGGVVRDLLTLSQTACVETYLGGTDRVESAQVATAIDTFGRKHMQGLRPAELEVLQRVRTKGSFVQTSEDGLALLMTRRVLEYRKQGQPRHEVHPTIEKLLVEIAG